MRLRARWLACGAVCAAVLARPAASAAGTPPLTKPQQRCVAAFGKTAAKVASTRAAQDLACLDATGRGRLPRLGFEDVGACLRADAKGKLEAREAKLFDTAARRCAGDAEPPFLLAEVDSAAAAAAAAASGLLQDLLSANPYATACTDASRCRCQQAVADAAHDLLSAKLSVFERCAAEMLRIGTATLEEVRQCLTNEALPGSVAADSKGKLARRVARLAAAEARRCAAQPAGVFPGRCPGLTGDALAACMDARVECRACLALNGIHALGADCDLFDDDAANGSCPGSVLAQETLSIPSQAQPAHTPGTPGVTVTNPKLLAQLGPEADLNRATYTRYRFAATPVVDGAPVEPPDAILVLVPGFEGGAGGFQILAENLLPRALATTGQVLEVWGFDRRSHQLEDLLGLELAEAQRSPQLAIDWLFGEELGIPLAPELQAVGGRRAVFYDAHADVPFFASWTGLVHSLDVDAVVETAQAAARSGNVFLGGHSAGTGFTARYAATDFDLGGGGPPEPGYAKLRGLVLLEGGGGSSTPQSPVTEEALDLVEARFDGGLFGAVRDDAPRCVDGATACTPGTEDADCAAFANTECVEPTSAYAVIPGLLSPRLLAAAEPIAIQAESDPDEGQAILGVEQGGVPGNTPIAAVPDLNILGVLPPATAQAAIGLFVDDEGVAASQAAFIAMSVGALGPEVNGLRTWLDIREADQWPPCPGPGCVTPDHGPPPSALPAEIWGVEREPIDLARLASAFYRGGTNFTDWYYPSSGLSVTQGLPSLDTSLLSADPPVGRGRRDVDNVVLAAEVDVPVIAFGGSNGLVPVGADLLPFAQSIGLCTAPSCDGATPRLVDPAVPSEAFPTFGGVAGGFEVHVSEGYAHVDPLPAEDGPHNRVLEPLAAFLERNSE